MRNKICGTEGCPRSPTLFDVKSSWKTEFCASHAKARMVSVQSKIWGSEGCPTRLSFGVEGTSKKESCGQHTRKEWKCVP